MNTRCYTLGVTFCSISYGIDGCDNYEGTNKRKLELCHILRTWCLDSKCDYCVFNKDLSGTQVACLQVAEVVKNDKSINKFI